jgi:hypothetical protein
MTRFEKAVEDLLMRIQGVLWELEGQGADGPDSVQASARASGPLLEALQRIQQLERTKLRVREAEQAARRVDHAVAGELHALLTLVYADLSAAEFAAKGALQKNQPASIQQLVDAGYEAARRRTYQPLQEKSHELHAVAEQARSRLR